MLLSAAGSKQEADWKPGTPSAPELRHLPVAGAALGSSFLGLGELLTQVCILQSIGVIHNTNYKGL